jgi:hypothetical protein
MDFVGRVEAKFLQLLSSKSQTTTFAPASDNALQWFFPIKPSAPVTIATLFFIENSSKEFLSIFI